MNAAFDLGNMGDHKEAMRWLVREISRPRNAESPFAEIVSSIPCNSRRSVRWGNLGKFVAL